MNRTTNKQTPARPNAGFLFLVIALLVTVAAFAMSFVTYDVFGTATNGWLVFLTVGAMWFLLFLLVNVFVGGSRPLWAGALYAVVCLFLTLAALLFIKPCLAPIGIYFTVHNMGDVETNDKGVPLSIAATVLYVVALFFVIAAAFVPAAKEEGEEDGASRFTGGVLANFGIGLLAGVVTLLSLGLAYPAMRCMKLRYKTRNCVIDGRKLVFDGRAGELFKKYIVWWGLSAVTLGVYGVLFLPLRLRQWETAHTRFEGDAEESRYEGTVLKTFVVNLVSKAVTVLTLGIGSFWAHCYKERKIKSRTVVSGARLSFDGRAPQYFAHTISSILATVFSFGLYLLWLNAERIRWAVSHTHCAAKEAEYDA